MFDVKPYIPWDSVDPAQLRVPNWVINDQDEFAGVSFTPEAVEAIAKARMDGFLAPLYPPLTEPELGDPSKSEVCLAISEVIAQDPRALHDGRGKGTVEGEPYAMTFSTLRVSFVVRAHLAGDRATAVVVGVENDPGDIRCALAHQHRPTTSPTQPSPPQPNPTQPHRTKPSLTKSNFTAHLTQHIPTQPARRRGLTSTVLRYEESPKLKLLAGACAQYCGKILSEKELSKEFSI